MRTMREKEKIDKWLASIDTPEKLRKEMGDKDYEAMVKRQARIAKMMAHAGFGTPPRRNRQTD